MHFGSSGVLREPQTIGTVSDHTDAYLVPLGLGSIRTEEGS